LENNGYFTPVRFLPQNLSSLDMFYSDWVSRQYAAPHGRVYAFSILSASFGAHCSRSILPDCHHKEPLGGDEVIS